MINTNGTLSTIGTLPTISATPATSNTASVVNTLESDWQGLVVAGVVLVIGGYAIYKLMKW